MHRLNRYHLREGLLGDGVHQVREHLLVLDDPRAVQRIGSARGLAILVGDELFWFGSGSIKVSIQRGGSDLGKKLGFPQKVIFPS